MVEYGGILIKEMFLGREAMCVRDVGYERRHQQ